MRFCRVLAALVTGVVLVTLTTAQNSAAHPEMLVSTQWLADHLSDPKVVLVHVVHHTDEFREEHIPGARPLTMDQIASDERPGTELLPPEQLKRNLEAIGISDDSKVVIYAPMWDPMGTRLLFTLDYVGHTNNAMLDGGLEQWKAEHRPVSSDAAGNFQAGNLTARAHPEIVAKIGEIQKFVAGGPVDTALIDARPERRYSAGHLPGARSLFWEHTRVSKEHPVLKSPAELRQLFVSAGATPGKRVISYCEVGLQATHAYFVARYLGYDAAMYDGSWSEWSSTSGAPIVKGDSAK